jgi:hypothetical protein
VSSTYFGGFRPADSNEKNKLNKEQLAESQLFL